MATRLALRFLFGITALCPLFASAQFDETAHPWIRGIFTGNSPRTIASEDPATLASVEADDTIVVVGTGRSMQPLYPPGTVLVVKTVSFDSLRSGQTAIYLNAARRAVAHILIAKARDGWRAKGLNNSRHDMHPVREENLVGVVVAAYRPSSTEILTTGRRTRAAYFLTD